MTLTNLHNGLHCVEVPEDADDISLTTGMSYFLNYRFKSDNNYPLKVDRKSQILPVDRKYIILGTVTATEVSFDCEPYVDKIKNPVLLSYHYKNYKLNTGHDSYVGGLTLGNSFRSLIEKETGKSFVNPYGDKEPELKEVCCLDYVNDWLYGDPCCGNPTITEESIKLKEQWQQSENNRLKKCIILKEL